MMPFRPMRGGDRSDIMIPSRMMNDREVMNMTFRIWGALAVLAVTGAGISAQAQVAAPELTGVSFRDVVAKNTGGVATPQAAVLSSGSGTKSGVLYCLLMDKANTIFAKNMVDIMVNGDNTGGVAAVSAAGGGFTCSADGFSKFGSKQLLRITLQLPTGDVIETKTTNPSGMTLSDKNRGVDCICSVQGA